MNRKNKISVLISMTALIAVLAVSTVDAISPDEKKDHTDYALFPEPTTIDRVTHNIGNIVTTVDNWGLVGGYPGYLPSGEWPRNSGHDYLAEIRYWMGAVTPAGDTLVANTYDDFEALSMPISGTDDYQIYFSSDFDRYHDYDPLDTVGSGNGNPAFGWRVWDAALNDYEYNDLYSTLTTSYTPGGPTSLQDSHYRFSDAASGTSAMGLEVTHTVMQWNYCYNEDIMFIAIDITNASATDYNQFAFGLYVDIDVGGLDGAGGNGNLEDSVVYFPGDDLAYIFDVVGTDPGWGPTVQTGIMGTKLLETPDDIGMTAFRTDDWSYLPDDDPGRYSLINSTQFDTPLPPTDQYYVQCVRGINLTAGTTVRIVYALIAGADSTDFVSNADMAQTMYDNHYVGPQPPPTPQLSIRAGDEKVYLSWTDTSETALDPLSGENDFVGYKLYRSEDLGSTWGTEDKSNDNACLEIDYIPIASYSVNNPGEPIHHSYVDEGLINGVEYWYCLVAFDRGDESVDPLQSGFGIAGQAQNVISIRPETNPAGFFEAAATVEHEYSGTGEASLGEVFPTVFDASRLLGADYTVTFEDLPDVTYWHLVNQTTGDTVLQNQTRTDGEVGLYEIAEGLRVVVTNPDKTPRSMAQTALGGSDTTLVFDPDAFYGPVMEFFYGASFGDQHLRSDYELRCTGQSSNAWAINDMIGLTYAVPFEVWNTTTGERVSFSLYDFGMWIDDTTWAPDGVFDSYDLLIIVNYPYDGDTDIFATEAWPNCFSWMFGFDYEIYDPVVGDVATIEGPLLNSPDDVFTFRVDGVNAVDAAAQMSNIRVVPNPYFVQYSSRVETVEGQSQLYFNNLPARCIIRIYNLAGDLVRTIEHDDDSGSETWDLLSSDYQLIASGMYIYHVESEYGEHMGRFAVIK